MRDQLKAGPNVLDSECLEMGNVTRNLKIVSVVITCSDANSTRLEYFER